MKGVNVLMNEIEWIEDYILELEARKNEAIEEKKVAEAKYQLNDRVIRDMRSRLREIKNQSK